MPPCAFGRIQVTIRPEVEHGEACIAAGDCNGAYAERFGAVDWLCGGERSSGFSSRSARERRPTAAHSGQRSVVGRKRSVSVSVACLRTGSEDPERHLSAALLLLLRPWHGPQEPAQLLRRHSRRAVLNVPEGTVLLVSDDQAA